MATGRIGTTPVLQVRWSKAPSAGTTSLSGLDDNSVSLVYSVGYEAVYRNGVLLSRTNDYTATNGTTITLIDATIAGDIIEVFANQTIPLADTYSQTVANGKFINNTLTTTTGDIIYASAANTPARLGIGSTDQVLKVSGGIPAWGAAAGGWTLLSTTTLSGATTTLTVSSGYKKIVLWMTDFYVAAGGAFCGVQINGNGSNYTNWYPEIGITANNVNYAGYFTAGGSQIEVFPSGMAQSNMDGVCVIEFDAPDETNMQKTYRAISRYTNSSSNSLAYNTTGIWRDSTAITTLAVKAGNSTWSGGTAYLYGVK